MMIPSIKEKWLIALRSGKFKQGFGRMEENGAFCPIGVLAQVTTNKPMIPYYIRDQWGLEMHQLCEVAVLNDELKLSFEHIADWVEANL